MNCKKCYNTGKIGIPIKESEPIYCKCKAGDDLRKTNRYKKAKNYLLSLIPPYLQAQIINK